jgi:hypothetical protein
VGWRRLHNEELRKLYASPNVIRVIKSWKMRRAGHVACMGEMRNAYRILVGKPEEKRSLGGPRRRSEDNIRMDLRGKWWEGVDWIHMAQDKDRWWAILVNTIMKLRAA